METSLVQKARDSRGIGIGGDLHEYLLVAQPKGDVYNKVMAEKQRFYEQFKGEAPQTTEPEIVIASFLAKEVMEDTILRYMNRILGRQKVFTVMLNNYSGLASGRIYLRVQNPQPFLQLIKELEAVSGYVQSCSLPPVTLARNPNVSITDNLAGDIYFKALMQYSQKTFHETFAVTELVLLRHNNEYNSWKPINKFQLIPANNHIN